MELSEISARIGPGSVRPASPEGGALRVSQEPKPFVAPTLRLIRGAPQGAEVISIKAAAAVGKSVTATHLSATTGSPLLDLASVAVGAGSLQGMLSAYSGDPSSAVRAFHRGDLPVVIDAIDEGVLYSGARSFEAFLQTAVEFMLSRRHVRNRAKLILLGRDDSVSYSNLVFELLSNEISICEMSLDYFDREAAVKMIPMYANWELDRLANRGQISSQVHQTRQRALAGHPMQELFDAYFRPIEFALGINEGQLWEESKGREFAGYAPLLSSIGSLLAQIDNPIHIANRLKEAGSPEAWDVIATVIEDILEREQGKLREKLSYASGLTDPYSPNEQLTYLTQVFLEQPLELVDTLGFQNTTEESDYREKVESIRVDHPFVRDREMTNDVLGSKVFCHAICRDLLRDDCPDLLKRLSRKPFLWRFFRRELSTSGLYVVGRHVGCILNSYWNDPFESKGHTVSIIEETLGGDAGFLRVTFGGERQKQGLSLLVEPPVYLYERMQDCEVYGEDLQMVVEGSIGDASYFQFRGVNSVVCDGLAYSCDTTILEGSLWLDAQAMAMNTTNAMLTVEEGSEYGWGDHVKTLRPWRNLKRPTLRGPQRTARIIALIEDCERSLGNRVVVGSGYRVSEEDRQMDWTRRQYGNLFGDFLQLLVESGLVARPRLKDTSGRELRFTISFGDRFWGNLLEAVERKLRGEGQEDARYDAFLDACGTDGRFGIGDD